MTFDRYYGWRLGKMNEPVQTPNIGGRSAESYMDIKGNGMTNKLQNTRK